MDQLFELKIDAMAHGGEGIGRYDGRAIFVPYSIPGETIRATITKDHRRYARARLVEVLEPSPARVKPQCPFFGPGKCGGCQWQHIAYDVQSRIKGLVVRDQFQRVGKFDNPPILEPIPDKVGWAYRNHALFRTSSEGHLGFLSSQSHSVYPVDSCMILHPLLNGLIQSLDMVYPDLEWLEMRVGTSTREIMLLLQTIDEEPPSLQVDFPISIVQICHDDAVAPLIGLDYIMEKIREKSFRISATSFFQVNILQANHLVDLVLEAAEPRGTETILDAYCGVGLFTAFLADQVQHITGIEINPSAVADALHNLAFANNVEIVEGAVQDVLPELDTEYNTVIVDPPRTGLERYALDALGKRNADRFIYISCDPATLARDVRRLERWGYVLEWIQPVDMFPQTYHIENIALLIRDRVQ
jgi:23S rRNA (uracil1939-C5)-methyltransferase